MPAKEALMNAIAAGIAVTLPLTAYPVGLGLATLSQGPVGDGPWHGLRVEYPKPSRGVERVFEDRSSSSAGIAPERRDFIFEGKGDEKFRPVRREDIKGIDPILRKLESILHYLKNFQRLRGTPFRIPRGIIFHGKPGAGKSMTACFVASATGARFVNVRDFPGVKGFFRKDDVKELFALAQQYVEQRGRPIVLFWDEFDTIAVNRNTAGLSDEKKEAVTELTSRIQGTTELPPGVLVIGATNNFGVVDPALQRKGRLGLHLEFQSPNFEGKRALLRDFVGKLPHADDIDDEGLAGLLKGDAVAPDIADIVAEAYRLCQIENEITGAPVLLTNENLSRAFIEYLLGQRDDFSRDAVREFRDAVHEIGHALVATLLGLDVHLTTIIPTPGASGKTFRNHHKPFASMEMLMASVASDFGGQEAERIFGFPPDLGSTDDRRQAAHSLSRYVHEFGLGLTAPGLSYSGIAGFRIQAGMDSPAISDRTLREQEEDILKIYVEQRRRAAGILGDFGRDRIEWMARRLVERKAILKAELKALIAEAERRLPRQLRLPQVE
ncbi:MAG TPA: AAA family ATPase [bacterium]|nr:AAA family ATPase [bacterium]